MGSYSPEDLNQKEYKKLIDETYKVFERAIADNDIPDRMRQALESDAFLFGGLKAHAQLSEAFSMIKDGKIKSWSEIEHEFDKLNDTYNRNWLQAEYNFAVNAAQQAANWANTDSDGRYNLQYRTALDEKVREQHQALEGITLPKENEFWDKFYPPNGWNCRCTAVEVRKSKYAESDAEEAMRKGEAATSQIGKDGKNRLEIFRFNPGKEEKLFPPKHPYNKVKGAKDVEKLLKKEIKKDENVIDLGEYIKGDLPTNNEVKKIIEEYARKFANDFRNGLETIKTSRTKSYLMQHSMNYNPKTKEWSSKSTISISNHTFIIKGKEFNPMEELKGAFGAIKKRQQLTFNQEYAVESLWHEILHAKSKTKPTKLFSWQIKSMETVNQFVARHTYDDFLKRLGGTASHKNDILENGYGYESWISDFRTKLKAKKISEKKAVEFLQPHLMNDYSNLSTKISELFKSVD